MPLTNWQDEYQSALLTAHNALIPAVQADSGRTDVETAQVILGMARYAAEIREGLAAGLLPRTTVDVPLVRAPFYDELPRRAPAGATGVGPTGDGDGDADLAATATLPAPPVGSRAPQVCSTCGMPVQWEPARFSGTPRFRQAHWGHVDAVLGADHDVTMEE